MTKSELINKLYKDCAHFSASDVKTAVDIILSQLNESIIQNERIEIRGFGSFCLHERSERTGRNPRTGETLQINKSRSVHFKPGMNLKNRVNKNFNKDNK